MLRNLTIDRKLVNRQNVSQFFAWNCTYLSDAKSFVEPRNKFETVKHSKLLIISRLHRYILFNHREMKYFVKISISSDLYLFTIFGKRLEKFFQSLCEEFLVVISAIIVGKRIGKVQITFWFNNHQFHASTNEKKG